MATYLSGGRVQEFLSSGAFDVGGTISTYVAGTSTHRVTYPTIADALALTNANAEWPLVLDIRGMKVAAINGPTDVIYTNSSGTIVYTIYGLDASSYNAYDSNGNILLDFDEVASAVNYIKITNAASAQKPSVKSAGSDNDVGLIISSKNAGATFIDGGATGIVRINSISTGAIYLDRATTLASSLTVAGASTLIGNTAITGTLNVAAATTLGVTTLTGAVIAQDSLTIGGNLNFAGPSFNLIPAGTIFPYAGAGTVPAPFLDCLGQAVSRTTYATLFAAIGTTWGPGDGSTTFNVPSISGRTLVGYNGTSDALLGNTVGSIGGQRSVALTEPEMPAHTHSYNVVNGTGLAASGGGLSPYTSVTSANVGSTGGGTAHNNIQPSAVVKYMIRY